MEIDWHDPRKMWWVYCLGTKTVPVMYVGISAEPMQRFYRHMENFADLGEVVKMTLLGTVYTRREAEAKEKELHRTYPHARSVREAREYARRQMRFERDGGTPGPPGPAPRGPGHEQGGRK